MRKALEGITVVAVEQAVAAPYASSRLADAGARVIKVERPEADFARNYDKLVQGQSAYFVWLNRGKESVCLDLSREQDRAVLERWSLRLMFSFKISSPVASQCLDLDRRIFGSAIPA